MEFKQGTKSEIYKVRDPRHNSLMRNSYYADISFSLNGSNFIIPFKIDTGASYTVIGLKNKGISKFRDIINQSKIEAKVWDASDNELLIKGYIVSNFKITKDVVLPRLLIFFSEELGDKALLGLDILGLFDFQYQIEKNSTWGTFWINNYERTLSSLQKRVCNQDIDYIDPRLIGSLDDLEDMSAKEEIDSSKGFSALHKSAGL